MIRLNNVIFLGSLFGVIVLAACGNSGPVEPEAGEIATEEIGGQIVASPEAIAAAQSLTSRLSDSNVSLVATQRGIANIAYTQPRATREQNFIVTTFLVQNTADNALAGFQVDEFWFDTEGNTVTGDRVRFRQPIMKDEVVAIELRVPRNSAMDSSNYEFSHQNGDIEPTLVDELPEPEVEEEEEEEEGGDSGGA